jgi:hypothetical protein
MASRNVYGIGFTTVIPWIPYVYCTRNRNPLLVAATWAEADISSRCESTEWVPVLTKRETRGPAVEEFSGAAWKRLDPNTARKIGTCDMWLISIPEKLGWNRKMTLPHDFLEERKPGKAKPIHWAGWSLHLEPQDEPTVTSQGVENCKDTSVNWISYTKKGPYDGS